MHALSGDPRYGEFASELLIIVEIDTEDRITAQIVFNCDDIDAAYEELETRYLAGEAAGRPHAWSLISSAYAAFNRHEPARMAPDWTAVDHRRGTPFASTDITAYIGAIWDLTPDFSIHIEAVHRLSNVGAVYTEVGTGTSPDGFDAEWRTIQLMTVEGDLINRCELFDETDLDSALARFDELQPRPARPENAASRVDQRLFACVAARDWNAMAEMLTDGYYIDDRSRAVNVGLRRGRDLAITMCSHSPTSG